MPGREYIAASATATVVLPDPGFPTNQKVFFAMEELTFEEKTRIPVEMLLDPQTQRAVAYSNNHRLLVELASSQLIAYLQANAHSREPWDESQWKPEGKWRPMPDWATQEVRSRCLLVRADPDWHDAEALRAIPLK